MGRAGCRSVSAFHKLEKLGEGTYGSVYAARDKETDQLVALKRIKLSGDSLDREGMPQTSLREVGLLRRLRHPHVVSLLEVVVGSKLDSVFLVLERVDHDLSRLIDASPAPFSPPVVKRLAVQLFSAMAHLHANYVLHRDLKMSNLLYSDRGVCVTATLTRGQRLASAHLPILRPPPYLPPTSPASCPHRRRHKVGAARLAPYLPQALSHMVTGSSCATLPYITYGYSLHHMRLQA